MKGSQLEQLEADYKGMEEALVSFNGSIASKANCLPELKEREKIAEQRLLEMKQAFELENQISMVN